MRVGGMDAAWQALCRLREKTSDTETEHGEAGLYREPGLSLSVINYWA